MSAPAQQQNRGSQAQGVFQGAADEVDSAAQSLTDPENALTAVDTMDSAADFLEATANAFDRIGSGIIDSVYFDPAVVAYFEQLGQYVRQAVDPTREGADQIRKVHAEDIERINENDPKKRKWDIQAHD